MAEFIGSRISLISKRDIRYVGTLHEISSENSTVALEQVISFGTEGRRTNDYVAPSDNVYEYIVFRGSDVKDLRIEEGPKENNPPPQPPVPDDPAILGSARRPAPASNAQAPQQTVGSQPQVQQSQNQQPQKPTPQQQSQQRQEQQPPPQYQQHPPYPYPYPLPNPRFGPQGFPPGPGFPGMPYTGPPGGWYPPPGYGYHHMPPNQFHPHQMPIGPPGQPPRQAASEPPQTVPTPTGSAVNEATKPIHQPNSPVKPTATVRLPSSSNTPIPVPTQQKGPPPPAESKPDVAAALAPPVPIAAQVNASSVGVVPTGPKSGRIIPAIPLSSPKIKPATATNGAPKVAPGDAVQSDSAQAQVGQPASKPEPVKAKTIEEANRDARAAVAAAMAKLPPAPGQKKPAEGTGAMDNLTRKVNEMRTHDNVRIPRQPGTGGYAAGHRGGERGNNRGNNRGNRRDHQGKKVEIPTTDYDFQSANEKFNKKDLVKEAIASGSPLATPVNETNGTVSVSATNGDAEGTDIRTSNSTSTYNKASSFFDNISSESKDRIEGDGHRLGGREFRSEERQKNLETFGQGSVDNGYRGGHGRGGRGRGRGYGRGRGGMRGGYDSRGARNGIRGGQGAVATEG